MMKKINNTPTEHQEQAAFVQWVKLQFPALKFFAIPNGMRTSFKQAIKAKRDGMMRGVPDLCFPTTFPINGKFETLWIEFKRTKGGSVSIDQKEWHHYLSEHCNHIVFVAKGCDEAVKFIMDLTQNKLH